MPTEKAPAKSGCWRGGLNLGGLLCNDGADQCLQDFFHNPHIPEMDADKEIPQNDRHGLRRYVAKQHIQQRKPQNEGDSGGKNDSEQEKVAVCPPLNPPPLPDSFFQFSLKCHQIFNASFPQACGKGGAVHVFPNFIIFHLQSPRCVS